MKIGTTYPSFNWDIRNSFRNALGSSVEVKLMNTMEDLEEADLVAFPGGEDVNPSIYGKNNTHSHGVNNNRDEREKFFYRQAKQMGKPMFGMCRGLQFISAMLGLELIQDIYLELEKRHSGGHAIEKIVDSVVSNNFSYVNSLHHQGVFADRNNIQLLRSYRDRGIYITSMYENIVESLECDKIIATQFHPEFMHSPESNSFFTDLGQWVEKPEFTFSMEEYNNKLLKTVQKPKVAQPEPDWLSTPTIRLESSTYRWSTLDTTSIPEYRTYSMGTTAAPVVQEVFEEGPQERFEVEPSEEEEEYEELFDEIEEEEENE